jgi:hypothetical protein
MFDYIKNKKTKYTVLHLQEEGHTFVLTLWRQGHRGCTALCLEARKGLRDKGHICQVFNFAATTLTGKMNLHLSSKHDVVTNSDVKTNKILGYLKKYDGKEGLGATSGHEVTRDILLCFCQDLISFEAVSKEG